MTEPYDSIRGDLARLRHRMKVELPEPTSMDRAELSAALRGLDDADRCLLRMEKGFPEPKGHLPMHTQRGVW